MKVKGQYDVVQPLESTTMPNSNFGYSMVSELHELIESKKHLCFTM